MRGGVARAAQVVAEALDVEAELARRSATRSARRELVLVGEQQVVHLPERALRAGGLGGLGGELGVRVHVVERQVAQDVAQVVARVDEQLADDLLGLAAVRALEVAVLDERDRRVGGAADVVALGVDRLGEVEDVLGGADELARAQRRGQRSITRKTSQPIAAAAIAAAKTPSFASSSVRPVEREAGDQQRHREADAGDRAAARPARPSRPAGAGPRARAPATSGR